MNIFVHKNQQQVGPFNEEELRSKVVSGEFFGSDLAWHDGLTNWQPLERVLVMVPGSPGSMPPVPRQSSGLATASFIIAVAGFIGWIAIFAFAGLRVGSGVRPHDPVLAMVGLITLAGIPTNLLGAILGLVVVSKPASNRWMAIIGAVFNGLQFIGISTLLLIGLAHRRH